MIKMRTLLLALILVPSIMFGQKLSDDFTVTTAEPYKVVDAGSKEYIALDNGNIIMAKMRGEEVTLQLFGANEMKELARSFNEDLPKYTKFVEMIKLKNRVFYIYQAYNKKQKNFTVYSREIDTENAKFLEQKELLTTARKVTNSPSTGEISEYTGAAGFSVGQLGDKFMVQKSFDDSKVMINYRLYPLIKKDALNYDDIGFFVFDESMDKIWGQEVKMPYTEAQINNVAYSVSSKGNGMMLVVNRESKVYEVISTNASGEVKTNKLDVSAEKIVRSMKIKELENGNFLCAGFYANGIEYNFMGGSFKYNINGLMYFMVNPEGELLKNFTYDFTEDFIKQNLSKKQKAKVEKREKDGKAGIADLLLLDFVLKPDGSALFIGERQYVEKPAFGPNSNKTYYKFQNAVIIRVEKDGTLAWMKKLPKNQYGFNGGGQMSIAYMEGKTADYVTFVDNPKNINLDANGGVPERHSDGHGGFLTAYKIDQKTGDLEKHTICELNDIKGVRAYQFKTTRIIKSSDGVFLMEIYIKGKKDTMVKFQIN